MNQKHSNKQQASNRKKSNDLGAEDYYKIFKSKCKKGPITTSQSEDLTIENVDVRNGNLAGSDHPNHPREVVISLRDIQDLEKEATVENMDANGKMKGGGIAER